MNVKPPFLELDDGLQIPFLSIKGLSIGRPIPNAFKLYGAAFGGTRKIVINNGRGKIMNPKFNPRKNKKLSYVLTVPSK
jgi:hypothetical protein